jgi:Tol biopolymer transport system component/imidazolonepropionase-like amidohydrolase
MRRFTSRTVVVLAAIAALLAVPRITRGWFVQSSTVRHVELSLTEGTEMAAALSPDGRTLAIDLLGCLWIVPASGGPARQISDEFGDIRQPAWSPDGKSIAFQSYRDGGWHIWTMAPDGTGLKQRTFGPFDHREPHWSPDGTRIALSSDEMGNYDIWELTLTTGQLRQLTKNPANDSMPAYSPDGREIAFVSDRQGSPGIWAVDAEGHERLIQQSAGAVNAPSWSPDGKVIYNVVSNDQSRLMLGNQVVSSNEDVFPFRPQWISSTDFLYTADGKIKRRTLGVTAPRTIEFSASVKFDRPAFTPKHRDFNSTSPRRALGIMKPAISPDGKQVAFAALGDLWLMPIGGKPQRITNDSFVETDPTFSSDGKSLAYASDRSGSMDLWVRDLQTGQDRRLTDLPDAEFGPAFSPDGTRIAFLNQAGEVYTVNLQSTEVQKVHAAAFQPGRPTWSPDSRTVLLSVLRPYSTRFREGTSQMLAVSLDEQRDRYFVPVPHRSVGLREGDGPIWSPDGTKMAFVMEGSLWVMAVTAKGEPAGPPRRISNESADSLSWTGDSRQVLYLSMDKLKLASIDDGRVREIPLDLTWQPKIPTGRKVVHAGRLFDGTSSNIRRDIDLVIEGNRITSIQPHRTDLHSGEVVDASGLTVMPGLIEIHSHLNKEYGEKLGRIWLAYGITTVRNPAGNPYEAGEDREAFASGTRLGPRFFGTGYTFDGTRIYYGGSMGLEAGAQIDMELERSRVLGYDLIKTYVRLPDILQKRIIEFAHQNGMPVTSHELYPAVAFGADGVEHIRGTSRRGYSPKVSALNYSYRDVIDLLAQSQMTITPTINIQGGAFALVAARTPEIVSEPRFTNLFPPGVVQSTRTGLERARQATDRTQREAALKPLGDTVLKLTRAGGRVVAGTDAPINPFALSLLIEIEHYVDGGLSPFQALQTATINSAVALGAGADLGTLETGKLADLIAVEGNPLEHIHDLRQTRITIRNGEVFRQSDLIAVKR